MKKLILLLCFVVNLQDVDGQTPAIDSLFQKLDAEKDGNNRVDLINDFIGITAEVDPVLDMQNAKKLLWYGQTNKDPIAEALALAEIGYAYRAFGNTQKSLEYCLKATALAEETGNEKLIANTTLTLAHNYKDQANYTKAIKMYSFVAASSSRPNDKLVLCWAFNSLGQIYLQINKLDSALMYAQRAYELCIQIKNTPFSTVILRYLGSIHGKMGNPALAVGYFNMSIKIAGQINSPRWLNQSFTALAEYYHDVNQNDSSLVYAKKAIEIVNNTVFSNKAIEPSKMLLDIYENRNSDSAIKYFKIYKAANDSLFSTKIIQQTQAMTFENELRQQELAAEKIKAKEQRKQNIQYALLALGILTFIIFFLALSRRHITNTKVIQFLGVVTLLVVFEFLNLLLHPFLESITHHNPILMLLALVCIAALLVPLHHKLEHWATHKLVEKNKKIRLAAAKKTIEQLEK